MAGADIKYADYGYAVGGTGADLTTVTTDKITVLGFAFSGNADNATCAVTTKDLGGITYINCALFKTNGNDLDAAGNKIMFGPEGKKFDGLKVKNSNAADTLFIYVK